MNNENFHPILDIPPNAHALHYIDKKNNKLWYEYNGVPMITFKFKDIDEVGFRHGSDGSMQSGQYFQQIYLEVKQDAKVEMIVKMTNQVVNMKPKRAKENEAIFAQSGNVLIQGVNGLYDKKWDLLIDWNGVEWNFKDKTIYKYDDYSEVRVELLLTQKPMFINIRPYFYKNHLGYKYHNPNHFTPKSKPIFGWCSWEAFRRDINIEKISSISRFMEKNFKNYGMEYIQVDDGYQKMPIPFSGESDMKDGWMTCDESKFPDGHESIVETIKSAGFKPAIWTNANITNPSFPFHHKDDVIWYDGRPLKGEWIDYLYSCTEKNLREQVYPIFNSYKEKGYKYCKIDAIRHLLFDGLHECVRLGIMSNEEAEQKFRNYMQTTRDGLGDEVYYLASWGEMNEVIGLVDACRISMDSNPTWAGIRMQLFESARWFHTNRILFVNDPDHVCVRTKPEWAKSILSLISLTGELCMLSDSEEAYTSEKIDIIKRTMPPLETTTAETGMLSVEYPAYTWTKLHGFAVQSNEKPVVNEDIELMDAINMSGSYTGIEADSPFSSLWSFHIAHANRIWCIMDRIAIVPLKATKIMLSTLGLKQNKKYYAFSFWDEKYLGIFENEFVASELSLGCSEVVSFHEVTNEPKIIASNRHVSMDAISISTHDYHDYKLSITLEEFEGNEILYYLAVPSNLKIKSISNATFECFKDYTKLNVIFKNKKEKVEIEFEENYD